MDSQAGARNEREKKLGQGNFTVFQTEKSKKCHVQKKKLFYRSMPKCGVITNFMLDHVQSAHVPSLLVQLEPEKQSAGLNPQTKTAWDDTAGPGLLGPNANTHTLMNYVNSRLQDIIHSMANIWVPLQLDTRALCRFARW